MGGRSERVQVIDAALKNLRSQALQLLKEDVGTLEQECDDLNPAYDNSGRIVCSSSQKHQLIQQLADFVNLLQGRSEEERRVAQPGCAEIEDYELRFKPYVLDLSQQLRNEFSNEVG